jgi:hypothetical protein
VPRWVVVPRRSLVGLAKSRQTPVSYTSSCTLAVCSALSFLEKLDTSKKPYRNYRVRKTQRPPAYRPASRTACTCAHDTCTIDTHQVDHQAKKPRRNLSARRRPDNSSSLRAGRAMLVLSACPPPPPPHAAPHSVRSCSALPPPPPGAPAQGIPEQLSSQLYIVQLIEDDVGSDRRSDTTYEHT